jgi:hypothetical protein
MDAAGHFDVLFYRRNATPSLIRIKDRAFDGAMDERDN